MALEAGLAALLNADTTLTGIIAGRISPLLLPETPILPAVTYQVISTVPQYTLDGALGLTKTRIEFNAWGTDYADCKAVAQAVRKVLDGYRGTLPDGTLISNTTVVNSTDQYDSDARIYRVQTDYSFWASY